MMWLVVEPQQVMERHFFMEPLLQPGALIGIRLVAVVLVIVAAIVYHRRDKGGE